jgi:hypothetical protein
VYRLDLEKLIESNDDGFIGVDVEGHGIIDAFISPSFKLNNEILVLIQAGGNYNLSFYSISEKATISTVSLSNLLGLDLGMYNLDALLNGSDLILFTSDKKSFNNYLITLPDDELFTYNGVEAQQEAIKLPDEMTGYVKSISATFKKVSCIVFAKAKDLRVIIYKAKNKTQHIVNIELNYVQAGISIYFVKLK